MLEKIFGTKNDREIKRIKKIVMKINSLEKDFEFLSDKQLKEKTFEFKKKISNGTDPKELLIEAFATVREVSKRVLGMRHYDVQLIGGIVLYEGKVVEMKTGEGKTLVATCPMYLNALSGKGVHIVTVNDYLANRDRELMKPLFDFLNITTGVILSESTNEERKEAYNADITYGTTSQFGFDYLRDNMVHALEDKVQRGFNTCIIDEIDSVLIDEARTPLIISGQGDEDVSIYTTFCEIANLLERSIVTEELQKISDLDERKKELDKIPNNLKKDYEVNEKDKSVILTEKGIKKVEALLGIENLYDSHNIELTSYLKQALNAKEVYKIDKDYIVQDNKVIIIDTFTGRAMDGRRFGEGLHQAIEAKEKVEVIGENESVATITIQNYFKMYHKLSGMTGTGETEATEFVSTYGLNIIVVPPNKPVRRIDHPDIIYKTAQEKLDAIVNKIRMIHDKGQPILIGTSSIEHSEELSKFLSEKEIVHEVLNAKQHAKEAEIISQAGRIGAVTIATNMAGRGTDILLGGNPQNLALKLYKENKDQEFDEILKTCKKICEVEKKAVQELGGLFILGTERHSSRRIDNQLRGRAGRQGDVGESQFFISFEDEIMKLFMSPIYKKMLDSLNLEYGEEIKQNSIKNLVEKVQTNIESQNFLIRKNLVEYDGIVNNQRKAVYISRDKILGSNSLKDSILDIANEVLTLSIKDYFVGEFKEDWDIRGLSDYLKRIFNYEIIDLEEYKRHNIEDYKEILYKNIKNAYERKSQEIGKELLENAERYVLLTQLDLNWKYHIKELDALKKSIHLRSYAQKDPVIEYKILAGKMYEEMLEYFKEQVLSMLFNVSLKKDTSEVEAKEKYELCSCGSGKNYNCCCGREESKKNITSEASIVTFKVS